mmetsp:Transcript_15818/g.40176  ORF Transcript_15818/g.40176 Transcript_15818/m.40176 type:complete len:287 (-) Transcript_15818:1597-2457(-)
MTRRAARVSKRGAMITGWLSRSVSRARVRAALDLGLGLGHQRAVDVDLLADLGGHQRVQHQAGAKVGAVVALHAAHRAGVAADAGQVGGKPDVEAPGDGAEVEGGGRRDAGHHDDPAEEQHRGQDVLHHLRELAIGVLRSGGAADIDGGHKDVLQQGEHALRAAAGRGDGVHQVAVEDGAVAVEVAALLLQHVPQRGAEEAQDEGVRQPSEDGGGLDSGDRVLAARDQQRGGGRALGERPEHALRDGRVRVAVGGEAVDDEGAGVRGGHEVQHDASQGQNAVEPVA